jgi:hypothetical protein
MNLLWIHSRRQMTKDVWNRIKRLGHQWLEFIIVEIRILGQCYSRTIANDRSIEVKNARQTIGKLFEKTWVSHRRQLWWICCRKTLGKVNIFWIFATADIFVITFIRRRVTKPTLENTKKWKGFKEWHLTSLKTMHRLCTVSRSFSRPSRRKNGYIPVVIASSKLQDTITRKTSIHLLEFDIHKQHWKQFK